MEDAFVVRLNKKGKIISRHLFATDEDSAKSKVGKQGRVIGVRKVHAVDIIGEVGRFKTIQEDFVWSPNHCGWIPRVNTQTKKVDHYVITDDTTIDSIVFSKKERNNRDYDNKNRVYENELWYEKKK